MHSPFAFSNFWLQFFPFSSLTPCFPVFNSTLIHKCYISLLPPITSFDWFVKSWTQVLFFLMGSQPFSTFPCYKSSDSDYFEDIEKVINRYKDGYKDSHFAWEWEHKIKIQKAESLQGLLSIWLLSLLEGDVFFEAVPTILFSHQVCRRSLPSTSRPQNWKKSRLIVDLQQVPRARSDVRKG